MIINLRQEAAEELADAIILQAVEDYRVALHELALDPHDRQAQCARRSIKKFFRSGWFESLTNLNPEALITKLEQEAQNEKVPTTGI
jgi:hypothetical protein